MIKWKIDEEKLLWDLYPRVGPRGVHIILPHYTLEAIHKKAQREGIQKPRPTEQQIKANAKKRYDKWRKTEKGHSTQKAVLIRHHYGSLEAYEKAVAHRVGKDGVVYDSSEEALVANALALAGVQYKRNRKKFGRYVPDFIVNGEVLVEYFGLLRSGKPAHQGYKATVQNKITYYTENGYKFVPLYHDDLMQGTICNRVREVITT